MRTYQHTAFAVLERYIAGQAHKRRRRQFLDMDFASRQRLERVPNRTAQFRCVFGSADGYGVQRIG
jgi:hypothetical protein